MQVSSAAKSAASPALQKLRVALEVEIPSDVRYIEHVVEVVARQCTELRYNRRQTTLNLPVALTEALSNAILRGNREASAKHVQIRCDVDSDRLVVEVVDEGTGFDLAGCMEDPTRPENIVREDGRGLFLMSRLMDSVERFSNHGNVVRMTLRRHD
ncbi:MAG TPA: ATP-binding protein [Gemmatimonadaceae bacterium]|jgi:Anti-sigma regulatory factor (Ser/Thr protein kinase)